MRYFIAILVITCAGCIPIPQFDTTLRIESEPIPIDIQIVYGDVVDTQTYNCTTPCELTLTPGTALQIQTIDAQGYVFADGPPAPTWEFNPITGQYYLSPNPVLYILRRAEASEQ